MAEIALVPKAKNDWHESINQIIKILNAWSGEDYDPLSIQTIKAEGAVTPINGATRNASGGYISWVQLTGCKIVMLNLMLNVPKDSNFNTPYGQIPSNLAPDGAVGWRIYGDENATLTEVTADGKLWANGYGLKTWQTAYIRKD